MPSTDRLLLHPKAGTGCQYLRIAGHTARPAKALYAAASPTGRTAPGSKNVSTYLPSWTRSGAWPAESSVQNSNSTHTSHPHAYRSSRRTNGSDGRPVVPNWRAETTTGRRSNIVIRSGSATGCTLPVRSSPSACSMPCSAAGHAAGLPAGLGFRFPGSRAPPTRHPPSRVSTLPDIRLNWSPGQLEASGAVGTAQKPPRHSTLHCILLGTAPAQTYARSSQEDMRACCQAF